MQTDPLQLWERYKAQTTFHDAIGLSLDLSRINLTDDYLDQNAEAIQAAFQSMADLEAGAIANPDENRMVGHYWLRNKSLAPTDEIRDQITNTLAAIKSFAESIRNGTLQGADGPFENLLIIGIGGSALGPQFVYHALKSAYNDQLTTYFIDNTDPQGFDDDFSALEGNLGRTLVLVISKSGGTRETRNGMLETQAVYQRAGLDFSGHACAITGVGSKLDQIAQDENWLARFEMWDWVGGRTSETSAVGLLPAALQGIDINQLLAGAKACDEITRNPDATQNPAMRMALAWKENCNVKVKKNLIILPYKDRLELISRYLQQLIMESVGKEKGLNGAVVEEGISVFGNKGSTDQHAFVQQLRDGDANFFVTFIEVLKERSGEVFHVEHDLITAGDYLSGFLQGTRRALYDKGRESMTIAISDVSAFSVGVLIALFERAVGFYAALVNINAYHQPGVEAGKKAAERVIEMQLAIYECLMRRDGSPMSVDDLSIETQSVDEIETIYKICEHLVANGRMEKEEGDGRFDARYCLPRMNSDEFPLP